MKNTIKAVVTVLVGLAVLVSLPGMASASQYTGTRHRSNVICIQQDVDSSMGLTKAAVEWNKAGMRYFVRGDRSHPNGCTPYVAVSQTVFVSYYSSTTDNQCAVSVVWPDSRGYVIRSEIRINLALLARCTGHIPSKKAAMMMHELGHDGGLRHVQETNSIMCSGIPCPVNYVPSSNDLWRMNWRYRNAL
jgi:hypothetical protein